MFVKSGKMMDNTMLIQLLIIFWEIINLLQQPWSFQFSSAKRYRRRPIWPRLFQKYGKSFNSANSLMELKVTSTK